MHKTPRMTPAALLAACQSVAPTFHAYTKDDMDDIWADADIWAGAIVFRATALLKAVDKACDEPGDGAPVRPDPVPLLWQAWVALNAVVGGHLEPRDVLEARCADARDAIAAAYPEVTS